MADRSTPTSSVPTTVPSTTADPPTPTGEPAANEPASEAQLVRAEVPRIEAPAVTNEDVARLVASNSTFAFDLYRVTAQQKQDNLIYSPYSISLAFSMVYAGARGETQTQMARVLRYLPQAAQHPAFNVLDQRLSKLGQPGTQNQSRAGVPFQLHIANAVWGQQGFPFAQPFLEILAQHYGAGLRVVDFRQAPEAACEAVNAWVARETEQRIKDLIAPQAVTPKTCIVLANAIYFKASWLSPFMDAATRNGTFTLVDGGKVSVPMMYQGARVPYTAGDGYQVVELPYQSSPVSMLIILPEEGRFEEIENRLSAEFVNEVSTSTRTHDVLLTMPRFQFETGFSLPNMLSRLGMPDLFDITQANLSGISEADELFVSEALHKAFIKVNEKGTETAAATGVMILRSALQRADMAVDRPFIFAIVERETSAILFLGRVMNPAQ